MIEDRIVEEEKAMQNRFVLEALASTNISRWNDRWKSIYKSNPRQLCRTTYKYDDLVGIKRIAEG